MKPLPWGDSTDDSDCDASIGEACCPLENVCKIHNVDPGACGEENGQGIRTMYVYIIPGISLPRCLG